MRKMIKRVTGICLVALSVFLFISLTVVCCERMLCAIIAGMTVATAALGSLGIWMIIDEAFKE